VKNLSILTTTHVPHFYDSASSYSTISLDAIRRKLISSSDVPFHNKHISPLLPYAPPMFGFTHQVRVFNSVRIRTSTPISHIYHSTPSQSPINPDTIWRSTKFQKVSNNIQGSWAPIFTQENTQWLHMQRYFF
jgi:hypothetical protein